MVSLTVSPLLKTFYSHWDNFYWGALPFCLFILTTGGLIHYKILTWEDPIQALLEDQADESKEGK